MARSASQRTYLPDQLGGRRLGTRAPRGWLTRAIEGQQWRVANGASRRASIAGYHFATHIERDLLFDFHFLEQQVGHDPPEAIVFEP